MMCFLLCFFFSPKHKVQQLSSLNSFDHRAGGVHSATICVLIDSEDNKMSGVHLLLRDVQLWSVNKY